MSAVTLLGLGNMGRALAHALLDAGHEVTVWNRTAARGRELEVRGAHLEPSVHEAVAASGLLVTCLRDVSATASVLARAGRDVLAGRTVVSLSGGRPDEVVRLRRLVEESGGVLLAGIVKAYPASIGTVEAEIQVAGPQSALDACATTLEALGRVVHAGPDAVVAAHLYQAQSAFFETALCAFFEALAYGATAKVATDDLLRFLPATLPLVGHAIDDVIAQLRGEQGRSAPATEAAVGVYASALASIVEEMRQIGARSALAEIALGYLSEASEAGSGGHEISALLSTLLDERPARRP
jgi:3-hydroxyisobutyrate dehydrogenase-like beta-hydroxyacid dehydrogenase